MVLISEAQFSVVRETSARFEAREDEREAARRRLETEGILGADSSERVQRRLERLQTSWSLACALEQTPAVRSTGRSLLAMAPETFGADVLGLERLMGRNDMIDVGFLERGWIASRSVGRIAIFGSPQARGGYGTGFLVSPSLLLTNNHVLPTVEHATHSYVEFDLQAGRDGLPLAAVAFRLQPERLFVTSKELDYTVVAVRSDSETGTSLTSYGFLPLIEAEGKVILGELVNIVQHPNGEPKQLALRENRLVDLLEHYLHYSTDTAPGSSGSPVFNDQWEVVALHHSGAPRTDSEGRWLAVDGRPWTAAMGEEQIDWKANEGVRISRVLRSLREQPLIGVADELRSQLGDLTLRAPVVPGAAEQAQTNVAIQASDTTQFTVPLTISISVGSAASPRAAGEPGPPAGLDAATLTAGLASLDANRERPYYDAERDEAERSVYYADVDATATDTTLLAGLAMLVSGTHTRTPRYKPAALVYPWVDLHPDRQLRSVYSGKRFAPEELIEQDARIEALRTARLQEFAKHESALGPQALEAELVRLEATLPYNCEHVVPQSSFAAKEPMRGDLHHLFACESGCNSFRGNTPYYDFDERDEALRHDCGRSEGDRFEPAAGKGAVARATLYFLVRYPGLVGERARELQPERLAILLAWHASEPVGEWERHRNQAIAELQGNRNPFVDDADLAARIGLEAFGTTFTSPP